MSPGEAQPDRTAVYGPVCTVVWEGRRREASPYPDHWPDPEDLAGARGPSGFGGSRDTPIAFIPLPNLTQTGLRQTATTRSGDFS